MGKLDEYAGDCILIKADNGFRETDKTAIWQGLEAKKHYRVFIDETSGYFNDPISLEAGHKYIVEDLLEAIRQPAKSLKRDHRKIYFLAFFY
ncbi:hypothetical protein [Bacillus sp. J14TS2]|uniref:hypothetical protein n=1 Tax=Bacillus sp. J14TS2 TaxID=2807188 RepID=UPI001BB39EE3|nr:hypothetical protein [Bacillus sp. J14TS2]